ncbi:MAG TPA: hypothetical protein VMW27_17930 [Thermoanaerobaculia bacterium]|nr:hypothetical protein [Thermoanaerobaculia bacterium]
MPAALTHKSIMLLARRRLGVMYRALEAKQAAGGPVSDLERRVAHLAKMAYDMLSATDPVALEGSLAADPLAQGVSQFAVMGSMGPDIPAFAALLAPGQGWIFDTVHKGSPDHHREFVHAGTTDFILAFWQKVSEALATESDPNPLKRMRAYVLGHLAHIAGDVISHPFVNDVEWHAAPVRLSHSETEGSNDALVARQVLGRSGTREGQSWDVWWPGPGRVPEAFYSAYAEALEDVYSLRTRRRTGFAEYERGFQEHRPPALDAALIKDGYKVYRDGAIGIGYGWGWGKWFGLLSMLFLPLLAAPYLVFALPNGSQLYRPPREGDDADRGWWEVLELPLAFTAPVPVILGAIVASLTTKGVDDFLGASLFFSAASIIPAIAGVVIAFTNSEVSPAVRWAVLFGLPVASALVPLFFTGRRGVGYLPVVMALPLIALAAFFLVFGLLVLIPRAAGASPETQTGFVVTFLIVWTALMLFFWFWLPAKLRDARIPESPEEFPGKRHTVRLFDDATLFHEPPPSGTPPAAEPTLAQRLYPSSRRPLLKIWWEGSGTMTLRSDRFQLFFQPGPGAPGGDTAVRAPLEPLTLAGYIRLLERSIPGVKAAVFETTDPDYVLPPGAAFADHGDAEDDETQPTVRKHDDEAAEFKTLGTSADNTDYVLYHAPRTVLAVRLGTEGPSSAFGRDEEATHAVGDDKGFSYVHNPVGAGDGDKVMDFASDFAALLMMGGASRMLTTGERAVPRAGSVPELHQVFRNWCLDRRRVNEWRMLVAGGAIPEKGARPQGKDPLMSKTTPENWTSPLFTDPDHGPFDEGERIAHSLGWVPLLRKWLDVARRPDADVLAATRLNENDPTNHELSRGMAYLLDMPDPQPAP